jgi:hypothetical protein
MNGQAVQPTSQNEGDNKGKVYSVASLILYINNLSIYFILQGRARPSTAEAPATTGQVRWLRGTRT